LPVKNEVSHECDALANGLNIIFPEVDVNQFYANALACNQQAKRRAASYGPRRN
jgi:hypothetical protein